MTAVLKCIGGERKGANVSSARSFLGSVGSPLKALRYGADVTFAVTRSIKNALEVKEKVLISEKV